MIGLPLNDHRCLAEISQRSLEMAENRDATLLATIKPFREPRDLARWIRQLPQRDDEGSETDGPRVEACDPSQRLRIPTDDPNCVERAALYLAGAELLDPHPVRQLATIDTSFGRHTIAVENGCPVVLDPRVTRNAAEAGLFRIEPGPVEMSPSQAIEWVTAIAGEPARAFRRGPARVRNSHQALTGVMRGRSMSVDAAPDVAFTLALAEREARLFGPHGVAIVRCSIRALSDLEEQVGQRRCGREPRNALQLRLGRHRIRPDIGRLSALGRVGEHIGYRIGTAALRAKLASLGVTGPLLGELERELNREGLSLGPLARPAPMPGTLAAVGPDAIAGRWLASRIG